jgi:hypothetical protein
MACLVRIIPSIIGDSPLSPAWRALLTALSRAALERFGCLILRHDTMRGRIANISMACCPGFKVLSTTLVVDLQFKLCCSRCGRRSGFAISIRDERDRGDSAKVRY